MNKTVRCSIIACSILFSGCATLSKSECTSADWHQIGQQDGAAGQPFNYSERHQKSCSKHGVDVDLLRYSEGRETGLIFFCTAESGYIHGINGLEYAGACPNGTAEDFTTAYINGLRVKLDHLAIEHDILYSQLSFRHLRRPVIHNQKRDRGRTRQGQQMRSRLRNNLSKRLQIQQWIAQWAAP